MTARYLRLVRVFPHETAVALARAGYDIVGYAPVGWLLGGAA